MRISSTLSTAVILIVVASAGFGDDAHSGRKTPPTSDKTIKALIEQLASPNPKPITGDEEPKVGPDYRLPPGFNHEKQVPVREARSALRILGSQAFPMLIERWDDKRYSLTVANGLSGWCRNQTVGKVCQTIIYDHIQPYGYWQSIGRDPRGKPLRPRYPEEFISSQETARIWWEKHKDKTLQQMQLEVLDWIIAEEAKQPKKYVDRERQYLQQVHQKLIEGKNPLPPGNYYCDENEK